MTTWTLETYMLEGTARTEIKYYYKEEDFFSAINKAFSEGRAIAYAERCAGEED